jgi:hypothetical protein
MLTIYPSVRNKIMYEIITIEQEVSGFYMCRVRISESECIFLKFSESPTQEQVDYEVTRYLENLNVITE